MSLGEVFEAFAIGAAVLVMILVVGFFIIALFLLNPVGFIGIVAFFTISFFIGKKINGK